MRRARFETVFFDVDSTLVALEGIDVLADGDPEIARLTDAAMNGEIPIDRVYALRLERIRPRREAVEELGRRYLDAIVPGAEDVFTTLHTLGTAAVLVTAGIRQAILPLAARLAVPDRLVHAVELRFTPDGSYAGFDENSPLTRPGGKEVVVMNVRARSKGRAAFVGDGITDLEAKGAVDLFIGFGGVRVRERVAEDSQVYVREPSLAAVLPYLIEETP
ncbi:MAG: HAD-IB family phosphatase [Thermoanaerobaculia bacterium]